MKLTRLARTAALTLIVSAAALTSFAAPPVKDCGCKYCSHKSANTACNNDGATITCGEFLSFTLCPA